MSDSISRITSMLESARDLTLEAAAAASAKLAETPDHIRPKEVSTLLNSRSERDVLKGLKYVISLISSGEDASQYFTDVVKNVTSSSLKIRKLVYTYLLRYADKENDVALLSINAIQKSLGDKNDQVRALAIRVMSEIRISSIYHIVQLGIKKCASDPSPNVRKAAAISLVKVYTNHGHSSVQELTEHLKTLLKDRDVNVLSSAILSFRIICPENFDLIHGHFRRFCSIITELDEWAQIYLVELLTNYSRVFLPKPRIFNKATNESEFINLPDNYNEIPYPVYDVEFDSDLKLFLDSIKYLTYSRNEAVVLAVGRAFFHLSPPKTFKESQISASLVRILQTSIPETQVFILQSILYMAAHEPTLFVQYEKRFFLFPNDEILSAQYKLKILSIICNENNIKSITTELQYYALNSSDPRIAVESVKALGVCSQISQFWSAKTLKWLLSQITTLGQDRTVTAEFLTVIRYLVQQNPENNIKTVVKLAYLLDGDSLLESSAKESVIWLVGEFSGIEPKIGPDVLRKLVKGFAYEEPNVRYQIILLAAKIYSYDLENYKNSSGDLDLEKYGFDGIIPKLFSHVINLGKYDDVYDIRDRSRMLHSLLSSTTTHLATLILQAPKPVPLVTLRNVSDVSPDFIEFKDDDWKSLCIDDLVKNYNLLPPWSSKDLPDSSIRNAIEVVEAPKNFSQQTFSNQKSTSFKDPLTSFQPPVREKKYKLQSLDDFFAEDNSKPLRNSTVTKKKVVIQEESGSSSEDGESSDEEDSSSGEEESSEEEEVSDEEDEHDNNEDYIKKPLL